MFAQIRVKSLESRVKILIALILTALFFILTPSAHAQTASPSANSLPTINYQQLPTNVSPTSPIFTDLILQNTFHSFSCLATGSSIIGQPCLTYISGIPVLSQTNLSGGALGAATSIIGALYMNPPVRTASYLASLGEGMGLVKTANAQVIGSGAGVLDPILKLWQVSRNISYLIMIIIFVIIGIMVMFRQRINPQTVITAQAALPGLVIGLILITFSYFLASLITDTSFLGINVVGAYFSAAQPGSSPKLVQDISTQNVGTIFSKYVGMISQGDIADVLSSVFDSLDQGVQIWLRAFAAFIGYQTGSSLGGSLGTFGGAVFCGATTAGLGALPCGLVAQFAGNLIGGISIGGIAATNPTGTFAWVFYFAAIAILIYTMIKLLYKLILNYLNIIFLTITAPFHFLAASLPGRQGVATNWALNMLCNALAFPAVFAVFYFVAYIWGAGNEPGNLFGIITNPQLSGTQTLPLLGGINLNFIRVLLAFGALTATPAIPDIICRTIGKPSQAGQLLGQEISGGTKSGQGYASQLQGRIGGVGESIGKTVGGEISYQRQGKEWIPYYGKPGFKEIFGEGPTRKGTGAG